MDELNCDICFEAFNTDSRRPKSVPCGHTVCLGCLQSSQGKEFSGKKGTTCPMDRKHFPNIKPADLPDTFYILSRLEQRSDDQRSRLPKFLVWCAPCGVEARAECLDAGHNLVGMHSATARSSRVRGQREAVQRWLSLRAQTRQQRLDLAAAALRPELPVVQEAARAEKALEDAEQALSSEQAFWEPVERALVDAASRCSAENRLANLEQELEKLRELQLELEKLVPPPLGLAPAPGSTQHQLERKLRDCVEQLAGLAANQGESQAGLSNGAAHALNPPCNEAVTPKDKKYGVVTTVSTAATTPVSALQTTAVPTPNPSAAAALNGTPLAGEERQAGPTSTATIARAVNGVNPSTAPVVTIARNASATSTRSEIPMATVVTDPATSASDHITTPIINIDEGVQHYPTQRASYGNLGSLPNMNRAQRKTLLSRRLTEIERVMCVFNETFTLQLLNKNAPHVEELGLEMALLEHLKTLNDMPVLRVLKVTGHPHVDLSGLRFRQRSPERSSLQLLSVYMLDSLVVRSLIVAHRYTLDLIMIGCEKICCIQDLCEILEGVNLKAGCTVSIEHDGCKRSEADRENCHRVLTVVRSWLPEVNVICPGGLASTMGFLKPGEQKTCSPS